jgi:hypothetical protein
MNANTWIILGVLAGAFSLFAIPYGFSLRGDSEKSSTTIPEASVKSNAQSGGITANSVSVENMTIIQSGGQTESAPKEANAHAETFALADCTFDAIFEIPADSLQIFQRAFPRGSGTMSVILHVYQNGTKEQHARLQLTGDWQDTSGMIPRYSEDLVVFILSERRFTLMHKKPIIVSVPSAMRRLVAGRQYSIEMTALPGFAIPLIPRQLTIRTHEGVLYTISTFTGPDKGWYSAAFPL